MSTTVYQAFRDTAARHGAQPFLCILPETAQAYGIEAAELGSAQASRAFEAMATAPGCCWRTAPRSSCIGSR